MDLVAARTDTSQFVYKVGSHTAYLLLYVDDIILTASSDAFLRHIIGLLHEARQEPIFCFLLYRAKGHDSDMTLNGAIPSSDSSVAAPVPGFDSIRFRISYK